MSKDSTPYQAQGDEALEARIVAWVLGEASPFEADELQRLCTERPELEIFRRRIHAIHHLLDESENQKSDPAWQLDATKRAALNTTFGKSAAAPANVVVPKKRKTRLWISAAASVALLIAFGGLFAPRVVRQHKSASETPAIATYSAKMEPYETEYPPALLEGTPVPITPQSLLPSRKAKVRSANPPSASAIPVPEVQPGEPSLAFGAADNFGGGWSEGELAKNAVPPLGAPPMAGRRFAGEEARRPSAPSSASARVVLGKSDAPSPRPTASSIRGEPRNDIFEDAPIRTNPARIDLLAQKEGLALVLPAGDADADAPSIPSTESTKPLTSDELAAPTSDDAQALRDLEQTVEEGRKKLATVVRSKGITYAGERKPTDDRDSAIQRGLDAQDYIEAKAAFENDLRRLEEMQARLRKAPEKLQAPPPALENETSAAADPFSTFSLNVSDAAFVIARDAIRRGERPAPEQVRVEQFYNALDYGDPAPAAGEAVAANVEQAAHPVLPGRNLVRIAARVGSTGRAASQPLHLTLLVDQSGSMVRADRRAILENTLATLATLLNENDVVHVIGFARQPRLIAEALPGNRAKEIPALVHQSAAEGGTNMEAALELAQQIAARHRKPGAQNRVVVLSDGAANLGDADPARLAERITRMRRQGIATDIAGIGSDGLNDALLAELARHGDGRYHIVTPETGDRLARDLAGAFRPAASDVKVQVVFNPERVGGWKLIGFEEHRLNTEDFRNDAVDAAELAAEEAGVAIYQVETLPRGRGEIGEVFIRFRDADTGRIVERSWPLPYEANAPALDQARPSMQLATLAVLTAEKLRGGPLGDSIDLTTHRPLIQSLSNHYRHDSRAQELFEMISALSNR